MRKPVEELRAGRTQVIRDQDDEHRALQDEGRNRVRLGCLPAEGERRAVLLCARRRPSSASCPRRISEQAPIPGWSSRGWRSAPRDLTVEGKITQASLARSSMIGVAIAPAFSCVTEDRLRGPSARFASLGMTSMWRRVICSRAPCRQTTRSTRFFSTRLPAISRRRTRSRFGRSRLSSGFTGSGRRHLKG